MKYIILMVLSLSLYAKSFMISAIPLPKTYIEDLDSYSCDTACMQQFVDEGLLFSFLAHANGKLENRELDDIRKMNVAIFNLGVFNNNSKVNIAIILPYNKIGKYVTSTTNAIFSYLMLKSNSFELKSYKIESEEKQDIEEALQKIKADGFDYVIAPFTKKGVENIITLNPSLHIYFPTINRDDVNSSSSYLYFGGIDYKKQSRLLLKNAVSPLVIFSDNSSIGKELAQYQKEEFIHPTIEIGDAMEYKDEVSVYGLGRDDNLSDSKRRVIYFNISRRTTNLEKYLKENEEIANATFFINTPIIKTGMIMSQLTLYDTNTTNILSTQINYDPLILSMTQYVDRKKMIIANSITEDNNVLIEANSLLHNDIVYDWINYTTTVGIDYFYTLITGEEREYNTPMENNQMLYKVELIRPGLTRFFAY